LIVVYSPRYHIDIGLHVFATDKYRRVRDRIVETGVVQASDIVEPRLASWDELALVHTTEYLEKLRTGAMTAADLAQLELPWSDAMVEGFRLMVGGTIEYLSLITGYRLLLIVVAVLYALAFVTGLRGRWAVFRPK